MNDQPLSGQVALVTGASRRIGRATALALAADGVVHRQRCEEIRFDVRDGALQGSVALAHFSNT